MTGSLNDSNSYQYIPNLQTAKHLNERVDSTRIVFRVFHSQSFRGYDPATGFVATGFDEKTSHHETRLAEAHLDCRNKDIVTPWISTSRRWLWAVWEMNRLFEGYSADGSTVWKRSNIRVAVIDLAACRGGSKPPVHALSILSSTGNSKCRDFANMSDEILIYGKVPPAAIISVWKFEKSIKIMGMPPLIWTKVPTGYYKPYRDFYRTLVQALEDPLTQAWTAKEEGERCASIVISMMQDGYRRLEERIDRMIGSVRETRRWAQKNASSDDPINSLINGMSTLSTGGTSYKPSEQEVNVSGYETSHPNTVEESFAVLNNVANALQKAIMMEKLDVIRAIQPADGDSEDSILDAYIALVTHHKSVNDRISGATTGNISSFNQVLEQLLRLELSCFQAQRKCYEALLVRMARQKIEQFRSFALEFARTVPLGLLDQMNIDQYDWATMRWSMMGGIDAWLAPLERKLEGLEDKAVPGQILHAKFGWLGNEQRYPKWWESWGTQLTIDGMEHTRGERYYAYLANQV